MTQELTNYIKENLAKGVPKDQIRQDLLQKGWKTSDIDVAFSQLETLLNSLPLSSLPPFPINQQSSTQVPATKEQKSSPAVTNLTPKPPDWKSSKWIDLFIILLSSAINFFLNQNFMEQYKSSVSLFSACNEEALNCNYMLFTTGVISNVLILILPGLLLVAIIRQNFKLALWSLLSLGLIRLLVIISVLPTYGIWYFISFVGLYYLTPLIMFLIVGGNWLIIAKYYGETQFLKNIILKTEVATCLVILIVISVLFQKRFNILNLSIPILTNQPFSLNQISKTSNQTKPEELKSELLKCIENNKTSLLPNTLNFNGEEYSKRLFTIVDGKEIPISNKGKVYDYGKENYLIQLSVKDAQKNPQTIEVYKIIIKTPGVEKKKLYGEEISFYAHPDGSWWIMGYIPERAIIEFNHLKSGGSKVKTESLEALYRDWFKKACSTSSK